MLRFYISLIGVNCDETVHVVAHSDHSPHKSQTDAGSELLGNTNGAETGYDSCAVFHAA